MGHNTAGDHRPDLVQDVLERRGDAKVAAAATNCPEQIRVLVGAHVNHAAVGHHHVGGLQVVERKAVLRHQPAQSATERQASDPCASDAAAGGCESIQLCLTIELSPQDATLSPHRARGAVHVNALHRRQIDHQAVIDRCPACDIVTAAADRHLEAERVRHSHSVDDIGHAMAAGDGGRTPVDQPVVYSATVVVCVIRRSQQLATERRGGEHHSFSDRCHE